MYPFKSRLSLLWDLFLSLQVVVCFICAYMFTVFLSGHFEEGFQRTSYIRDILDISYILCFMLNLNIGFCVFINRVCYQGCQDKGWLVKSIKITSAISLLVIFCFFLLILSIQGEFQIVLMFTLAFTLGWFFCVFLVAVIFVKYIQPRGAPRQSLIILLISFYAWLAIDFVFVQQTSIEFFMPNALFVMLLLVILALTLLVDFFIYQLQRQFVKKRSNNFDKANMS